MMRRVTGAAAVAAAMWIAAAITTPAAALAAPSTTYCNGTLAPGGYGKVIVPQGAVCTSDGPVRIRGGLRVDPGATFVLGSEEAPGDNGTINGVTARHAASVLFRSRSAL